MSSLIVTTENPGNLLDIAAGATASAGWAPDAAPVGFIDDEGRIVAVAVFQNRTGDHADLHIGVIQGRHLNGKALRVLVKLAFDPAHLGLSTLWVPIPEGNVAAQLSALKMGFRFEARRRGYAADGGDVILMALRRDDIFTTPATASPAQEGAPEGV